MSRPVSVGDPLPALTLAQSSGRQFPFSALAGEETLIVFLRHLR